MRLKTHVSMLILSCIAIMLILAGCAELAKIGQTVQTVGDTGQKFGEAIPVYGTIVTAIASLLSIGGGVMIQIAKKRGKALQAVIEAIGETPKHHATAVIKENAIIKSAQYDVYKYLDKWVQKYDPHKPKQKEG